MANYRLFVALGLLFVGSTSVQCQRQIQQVAVPYALPALEPYVDNATMNFHYGTHYAGYVNNLNAALANATIEIPANASGLTGLIKSVLLLPAPLNNSIRNQGGGAWNHALYFKHLAPAGSNSTRATAISTQLQSAIMTSFGSVGNMTAELTRAATGVFGSGWAWLCVAAACLLPMVRVSAGNPGAPLVVTTTPNQDNPLMGDLPGAPAVKHSGCTPILGIDVWEHAYYLKHGPRRADYLAAFWKVLHWQQVSRNYANALAGNTNILVV